MRSGERWLDVPPDSMAAFVGRMFQAITSHSTSLGGTVVIVGVLGAEWLISSQLFKCPCFEQDNEAVLDPEGFDKSPPSGRVLYGASFFVWPALAGFFLAMALNGATLRCLSSCRCHCSLRRHWHSLRFLVSHSFFAFITPGAWVVFVLIDGRYFECMASKVPTGCLPDIESVNQTSVRENIRLLTLWNTQWQALSQVISLSLAGISIALGGLLILCSYLCSPTSYYQRRFMNAVHLKELEIFDRVAQDVVTHELGIKWDNFLYNARRGDWEDIVDLPYGSPQITENNEYLYSPLHKWKPDPTVAAQTRAKRQKREAERLQRAPRSQHLSTQLPESNPHITYVPMVALAGEDLRDSQVDGVEKGNRLRGKENAAFEEEVQGGPLRKKSDQEKAAKESKKEDL